MCSVLYHLLHGIMYNSTLFRDLTITLQSYLMRTSTFCLLHSMLAVLGQKLQGTSLLSILPSLKCFSQCSTLLAPIQTSPQAHATWATMFTAKPSSFRKNLITALWQMKMSMTVHSIPPWCKHLLTTHEQFPRMKMTYLYSCLSAMMNRYLQEM